jgi:hypothetical protein
MFRKNISKFKYISNQNVCKNYIVQDKNDKFYNLCDIAKKIKNLERFIDESNNYTIEKEQIPMDTLLTVFFYVHKEEKYDLDLHERIVREKENRIPIINNLSDNIKVERRISAADKQKLKNQIEEIMELEKTIKSTLSNSMIIKDIEESNIPEFMSDPYKKGVYKRLVTDIKEEKYTLRLYHKIKYNKALELFNMIKLSNYCVFASYNNEIFKIYNEKKTEIDPKWCLEETDGIKMKVNYRKKDTVFFNKSSAYANATYNYNNNKIIIDVPFKNIPVSEMIHRFKKVLPIDINSYKIISSVFSFAIVDLNIDRTVFADILKNHKVIKKYFFIDESQDIYADKQYLKFHIKFLDYIIKVVITNNSSEQSKVFEKNGVPFLLQNNRKYINIRVTDIPDEKYYNDIKDLILYFFTVYIKEFNNIAKIYDKKIIKITNIDYSYKRLKNSLRDLKMWDKEFWDASDETRSKKNQLKRISENEIKRYLNKGYDVVKFPVNVKGGIQMKVKPKITNFYVSPSANTKYIGVRENKNEDTKDKFPYFLSTYSKPHLDIDTNTWEISMMPPMITTSSKRVLSTRDPQPGRTSLVPTKIMDAVNKSDLLRLGVNRSKSSLLYCVCEALNKKCNIKSLRSKLSKHRTYLCAQENYDLTNDEIVNNIKDVNVFFDPARYYRIVENYFKINLYVFRVKTIQESKTNEKVIEIEIPNHKFWHVRDYRNNKLPVVLVYKNIDNYFDLIVSKKDNDFQYTHPNLNRTMLDIIKHREETIAFNTVTDNIKQTLKPSKVYMYKPIKFIENCTPWIFESQYIDNAGKCICVTFTKSKHRVSVNIPPSPIFDIPIKKPTEANEKTCRLFAKTLGKYNKHSFTYENTEYQFYKKPKLTISEINKKNETIAMIIKVTISVLVYKKGKEFVKNLLQIGNAMYEIKGVPFNLPIFTTYIHVLKYFSQYMTSFIDTKKEKIIVSKNLYPKLLRFIDATSINQNTKNIKNINIPYLQLYNFQKNSKYDMIFDSKKQALKTILKSKDHYQVKNKITIESDPYTYKYKDKLYLIQVCNTKEEAKINIYNWYTYLVNNYEYKPEDYKKYKINITSFQDIPNEPHKLAVEYGGKYISFLPLDIQIK